MADPAQIETAIAALCAAACYPTGTGQPSVTGSAVRAYAGYPVAQQLDADLQQGICHVGVVLRPRATQPVPVSLSGPEALGDDAATVTWQSSGNRLTLYGAPTIGQVVTVIVDGQPFSLTQNGLPLNRTAAALASLIAAVYPDAYSVGTAIIVPRARSMVASVMLGSPATTTWTQAGDVLTLAGSVTAGQAVVLLADDYAFAYAQTATDTLATTAAALAALAALTCFPAARAAGAAITVPGAYSLAARVATTAAFLQPLHRQRQEFAVTIYAAGAANRTTIGAAIDVALAQTLRLTLPDATIANLRLTWLAHDDKPEKALLFMRMRGVQVEYDTVLTGTATRIAAWTATMLAGPNAQDGEGVVAQAGDKTPPAQILLSSDGLYLASDDAGRIIGVP